MTSFIGSSQVNLNEYKYIIVPKRFDGFKNENQHQTSSMVKYLFNKKGFVSVYDDNLPADLKANRCLGLVVDLIDNSTMFTTKTELGLNNCDDQNVFQSKEGRSKKKDYRLSYGEAITNAFDSFATLNYVYEPKTEASQEEPLTISFKNDIKRLEDQPSMVKKQEPMVEQIATEEVQSYKDRTPVVTDYSKGKSVSTSKMSSGTLYAQVLPNGYQLVDSTPKIQLKIFKSSMPNVYIAKGNGRDGVVYSSDGKWFFEYQEGDQVVKEELDIKF